MADALPAWHRPRFQSGGGNAVLLYALYGRFSAEARRMDPAEFRTAGLPPEMEIRKVARNTNDPLPFLGGDFTKILLEDKPELFESASKAEQCLILKGEFRDPKDLNYLRDTVGMISWFFDHGAEAAFDPQRLRLYDPVEWSEEMFVPSPPKLAAHIVILSSSEEDGTRWLHTRGMRKFGRPDISIHRVTKEQQDGAIELINRLILLQAEGGLVPEGQSIRMASLPPGLTCHHGGHLDDPDFNNTHIEIRAARGYSF